MSIFFTIGRVKQQTQQCQDISKKKKVKIVKNHNGTSDTLNSNDRDSSEDEVEQIDDQIENEAKQFLSVLMENMKALNLLKCLLKYLGNSRFGNNFFGNHFNIGSDNDSDI
ncbi:10518_t:CDS:2, partial [Funneliformis caledonium]